VNEKATADKETGHSANSPSVLEGFKKLDRTFCARLDFSAAPTDRRLYLLRRTTIANSYVQRSNLRLTFSHLVRSLVLFLPMPSRPPVSSVSKSSERCRALTSSI
jgi:hypothetical protein